ncbi:phage baseplate protein [Enterococcus sp. AZ126]|uniref:phage baseplate protein n=1 Tax=Enterococcus sp. AZ126 TaxID=2774635 RepID=UPI003F246767
MDLKKIYRGMDNSAETIQENFEVVKKEIHEVGAVISNVLKDFDPNTVYTGTWERIKGRMLVGVDENNTKFSTAKKIGGAENHIHELGDGSVYAQLRLTSSSLDSKNVPYAAEWSVNTTNSSQMAFKSGSGMQSGGVNVVGKSDSQSNLPPYYAVYMWVRTA